MENDARFGRIARISGLLSLFCALGIAVSCAVLVVVGIGLVASPSAQGGPSWVLERLAAGRSLSVDFATLRAASLTIADKGLLFALVLSRTLATLLCLILCVRILRDFRRARVFTGTSVRRVRLIGWVLLGTWAAHKVFAAVTLYLGGWNLPTFTLGFDGLPGTLALVALVFLVAWVLDIGRSMDVDRRLTI